MKLQYLLIALFISSGVFAQAKVGTVNTDLIISKMPEFKVAQDAANKYSLELETELKAKVSSYEEKIALYQKGGFTDVMKKVKETELVRLENDIKQFRQNGVQLVQLKQQELLRPLYEKITKTIASISETNNYSQILNLGGVELAYYAESHDITKLVMDQLGLKE